MSDEGIVTLPVQERLNVLPPTRYYYPSAASPGVPCRWEGYVDWGVATLPVTYTVVHLLGGSS